MLCYHRVEVPPAGAEGDTNFVTPAQFDAHVESLARLGYTGVSLDAFRAWQRNGTPLPPRPVLVSFDDAYASVVEAAVPVLDRHGWQASIFVVTGEVGGSNRWDPHAPRATLLDADALRGLHRAGHTVASHTHTHRRLRGLDATDVHRELAASRDTLEHILSARCTALAFPYGSHDRVTLDRVADAGYDTACTLKRWGNSRRTHPLRLGRMSVGGPLGAWALRAKLLKLLLTPARS